MKQDTVICNMCGKEIKTEGQMLREGVFHGEVHWGYFSRKDGESHTFNLCEDCYDAWIKAFKVPPEMKQETEMI